jgi:hypothetical protein
MRDSRLKKYLGVARMLIVSDVVVPSAHRERGESIHALVWWRRSSAAAHNASQA